MGSREQFAKWMEERIPAIYQGKRVMLHRYDTMSDADERIAKSAWDAAKNTPVDVHDLADEWSLVDAQIDQSIEQLEASRKRPC